MMAGEIFVWPAEKRLPDDFLASVKEAMLAGSVAVYPTSTLYGLGASIYSKRGLGVLNDIKRRPPDMPISIMATVEQIGSLCKIPEIARPFIESADCRITAILPALGSAPRTLVHGGTLAARLPCSNLTASLVECVGPVTATSANIHGMPTPIDITGAMAQFGDRVFIYIDSGTLAGKPTALVDYTAETPKIIREGGLSGEEMVRMHER
ncbi:MAG: L-threonylcarbamoyladenylate synthase [Thermoplasmata archaeon]